MVTDGVFNVLGVRPLLGHAFTREEDLPKGPHVVMLSYDLWQRRYGGDREIVGKTILVGADRQTVIAVMPADFHFPERAEMWIPLQLSPDKSTRTDHWLEGVGRL